jgi:hypothetical protein
VFANAHASCALTMIMELLKNLLHLYEFKPLFLFLKNLFFLPLNPFIIVPNNDLAFCNFGGGFMVLKM